MSTTVSANTARTDGPVEVTLEANKEYWWCTCGRSRSQPFCDGSHDGTDHRPARLSVEETRTAWLCGCKRTGAAPYCDGSHDRS